MLTGTTLRVRQLSDSCGDVHTVTILRPAATDANRKAFLDAERIWRDRARAIPHSDVDASYRAYFAVDVAFLAAATTRDVPEDEYIVAAVDERGAVVGISIFRLEDGVWHLLLHTVDPRFQGGSAAECQIRGIGSELLGADAALMNERLCTRVELEPLDAKAEAYWRSRGFHNSTAPLHLTCPELRTLEAAYAHTPHDDADQLADDPPRRRRVSLRV